MRIKATTLKALDRISPSQYSSLGRCAMKVVLANSFKTPLLPYPPHSHLGNVIHECISLILSKQVTDYDSFNRVWQSLINKEEAKLLDLGFSSMVPIKVAVKKGYSIKKLQVRSLIAKESGSQKSMKSAPVVYSHETWMSSKDGLIGGKADMIAESSNFIRITDFKSGRILDHVGNVNEDYEVQLKLYAYLFQEENGKYPDQLTLVDLSRKEYIVSFTPDECFNLAEEAKKRLHTINGYVNHNNLEALVNPCIENCTYCLFRPACNYHWSVVRDLGHSHIADIQGTLIRVKAFLNGTLCISLDVNGEEVIVSQVDNSLKETLIGIEHTKVALFNILASDIPGRYKMIKTTMIYDQQ